MAGNIKEVALVDSSGAYIAAGRTTYTIMQSLIPTADGTLLQLQGSASKTVRILRAYFTGTLTTGASYKAQVIRRSTTVTGGTAATLAAVNKRASANAAATATLLAFNAPPTNGTLTSVAAQGIGFANTLTGIPSPVVHIFGAQSDQPLIVSGIAEFVTFAIIGIGSYTGADFQVQIDWAED